MLKKLFKSKKVKATKNTKVEKLDSKELGNIVGGGGTFYTTVKGQTQGSIIGHP